MSETVFCELIASDVQGAEGPLTDAQGRLWFVSPSNGEVLTLEQGGKRVVANTGGTPAGLHRNSKGEIWIADMKRGILRLDDDGSIHGEVTQFEGNPIRGCNDLCFDLEGNLYFTAPAGSSADNPIGEVFCRRADGEVRRLGDGFAFCNGIAISADGRKLMIAETFSRSVWLYQLDASGEVLSKEQFVTLPGEHRVGPDGMDFDGEGNLIVTNYGEGTLDVFAPDRGLVRRIHLPFKRVSNIHFCGPGSTHLIVTEHESHAVWRMDYGAAGQLQPGWN